jgi:hypothetical protein
VRVGFTGGIDTQPKDQTVNIEGVLNYYLRGQEARLALSVSNFNPSADGEKSLTEAILFAQVSY